MVPTSENLYLCLWLATSSPCSQGARSTYAESSLPPVFGHTLADFRSARKIPTDSKKPDRPVVLREASPAIFSWLTPLSNVLFASPPWSCSLDAEAITTLPNASNGSIGLFFVRV